MSAFHHTVKTVTPFHDRSRHSRLLKIALWLVGIAVVLVVCHLGGLDVIDWFQRLWDTMTEISLGYIVAGLTFQTIQTVLTAVSLVLHPRSRRIRTEACATATSWPHMPRESR